MKQNSVELIKVDSSNLEIVQNLAERIWKAHYPGIITDGQIDFMLKWFYSKAKLEQDLDDGYDFKLILFNQTYIGYLSVMRMSDSELFISKFYIDPTSQSKGTGSKVLKLLIDSYPSVSDIKLAVNRKNFKSINFYFKNGFVIESVGDFDIGSGYYMSDFIMKKSIPVQHSAK